jgi:hypothetical protein
MGFGAAIAASHSQASHSQTSHGALASALGSLNAVHASPTALAHAAPTSQVGMLASYQSAMLAALAMPATTPAQIAQRNAAIASARADLLAPAANKGLTPATVTAVDQRLGLAPTDPTLGVTSSY